MELQVDIEEPWPPGRWEALAASAGEAAAQVAPELANPRLSASLLFTSDDEVRSLNRDWRQIDKPTNVLSFPQIEPFAPVLGILGDITLARETLQCEAAEQAA